MKIDLTHNKEKYTKYSKQFTRIMYWLILLVLGLFNFLIFLALIPFMMIMQDAHLYIIVSALGLLFGAIFSFLIKDIEHLRPHHHIFAALFIPVLSIINIVILLGISSFLNRTGSKTQEMMISSAIYVAAFALPYIAILIKDRISPDASSK